MLKHHTAETAGATMILLVCGTVLVFLSRRWGVGSDLMSQLGAAAGPVAVVLGIGAAIHGRSMPPTHITTVTRLWGTLGSLAAGLNLWSLGYFSRGNAGGAVRWLMPAVLIGAWWLPRRFYGGEPERGPRPDADAALPKAPITPPGSSSLSGLLDALEEVAEAHPELFDTDVRERLWTVVERRYVRLDLGYEIPNDLGMHTEGANLRLRAVLEQHLKNLTTIAEIFKLDTEAKRLRTLQNPAVRSQQQGLTYDAFFGSP
jgi:hypothetical protein